MPTRPSRRGANGSTERLAVLYSRMGKAGRGGSDGVVGLDIGLDKVTRAV
jgi:hypothetical protein